MVALGYGSPYEKLLAVIPELATIQQTADLASRKPARANKEILYGYTALSYALGRLLHGDVAIPENATFPTFAAWAAVTLRRETVLDESSVDPFHPARIIYRKLAAQFPAANEAIVRNVVRGQAAIYEEIGSAIYTLVMVSLDTFAAATEAGEPPDWHAIWDKHCEQLLATQDSLNQRRAVSEALDPGSVTDLQRAVTPYFSVLVRGLSTPQPSPTQRKERAELILLGNLRIVAYEQRRLQSVFERNLSYVPDAIRDSVANALGRHVALVIALRRPFDRSHRFTGAVSEAFQIAATRSVFSMILGAENLGLGRDIPVPPPANPLLRDRQPEVDRNRYRTASFFPNDLTKLQHGPTWAEWQLYDRSSGQGGRTAVNNWLRYGERMNFIGNMFRSRQQLTGLYHTPESAPPVPVRPTPLSPVLDLSDATARRLQQSFGAER